MRKNNKTINTYSNYDNKNNNIAFKCTTGTKEVKLFNITQFMEPLRINRFQRRRLKTLCNK